MPSAARAERRDTERVVADLSGDVDGGRAQEDARGARSGFLVRGLDTIFGLLDFTFCAFDRANNGFNMGIESKTVGRGKRK